MRESPGQFGFFGVYGSWWGGCGGWGAVGEAGGGACGGRGRGYTIKIHCRASLMNQVFVITTREIRATKPFLPLILMFLK